MPAPAQPAATPLLDPDALKLLACPVCHAALTLEPDAIRCSACARRYPIVDSIPVLLTNRAS